MSQTSMGGTDNIDRIEVKGYLSTIWMKGVCVGGGGGLDIM